MIDTPADTTGQARRFAIPLDGALWLLTVLYVLCIIDRQILNILAEPIARELGLSDTQIGLMAGLAFAAFYTVLGIPLARYADRPGSNRVGLMTICLFIWSGMTAVSGLAQNFIQLCLARMGVGVGEAGCTPAAHSMIADLYPADRRSSAMSVYGLGQPVGVVLGSMIGGLVAHQWGWRAAFMVVGIPGILLALLMPILLKDPRHRMAAAKTQGAAGLMEVIGEIAKSKTFVYMLVSGSVIAFLAYGMVVWTNIFFIRHFGLSVAQVGVWLGLVSGLSGAAGTLLGRAGGSLRPGTARPLSHHRCRRPNDRPAVPAGGLLGFRLARGAGAAHHPLRLSQPALRACLGVGAGGCAPAIARDGRGGEAVRSGLDRHRRRTVPVRARVRHAQEPCRRRERALRPLRRSDDDGDTDAFLLAGQSRDRQGASGRLTPGRRIAIKVLASRAPPPGPARIAGV
jgi:MFS family permease